jgi:archaeosine-15-forming tRNA-guanine transglycosylase
LTKKGKKEEFNTKDIITCYDEAKVPKPKNVTQHVQAVASHKKALLTAGSKKGYYKLTITGEEFVENELPHKSEG